MLTFDPCSRTIEHSVANCADVLYYTNVPAFPARRMMSPGFGKERRVASGGMSRFPSRYQAEQQPASARRRAVRRRAKLGRASGPSAAST